MLHRIGALGEQGMQGMQPRASHPTPSQWGGGKGCGGRARYQAVVVVLHVVYDTDGFHDDERKSSAQEINQQVTLRYASILHHLSASSRNAISIYRHWIANCEANGRKAALV